MNYFPTSLLQKLFEPFSKSLKTVEVNKALINEGKLFSIRSYKTAIAQNGYVDYAFFTPENYQIHAKPITIVSDSPLLKLEIFEDISAIMTTEVTPFQHNRMLSDITSQANVSDNISGFTPGTPIWVDYLLGNTEIPAENSLGGELDALEKIILKQATNYVLRITNLSTNTISWRAEINWFELPDIVEEV